MDNKDSIVNRQDLQGLSYDDFVGAMIKDSSGNATILPYSQAKEMGLVSDAQDLATVQSRPVYRASSGGFTRDVGKAALDASVVLDKETGKITVSAPKMVLDDESYKSVINPTLLKQLSSAYQRNENYKIPDPFDESNEEKDITIPEAVEKYDKAIKELTAAMQEEIQTRAEISRGERGFSNRNDIANRLTRDDMIIMGTNAMGEGANDKSLIAIPKFLYADLDGNGLLTFDRDSGTIEKGEFRKKIFSLIEHNEDYVDSIYNKLEEYFEDDGFDDTEEYARATALYSFILNNDPDMTPAQVANYVTSNFFRGLGHGISTVSRNIGKAGDLFLGASVDYIEEEYKDDNKDYEEAQKFLSRMSSAGATALGIGDVAGTIVPDIALSVMGGNMAGAFAGAATKIKGAEAIVTAARAGEAAKTAETVAKEAEALTAGADLLIAANNTKRAAELGTAAAKLSQTAARTSVAVDLATQTIVEAVISDPVVFGKILQNQEQAGEQAGTTQDAYGELLEIAAWNIGGWGAFNIGAKGLKSFSSTSAGRYTNAVAQKYLNKVPVYTGRLGEKILKARYGDEWLTSGSTRTGAARKGQARKYNYELRLAQENIAKQKLGSPFDKNVMSNVRKQEQNIVKLMNLQNSTDALQRGSTAYIRRKLDATINPVLSNYEQKLRKLGSDITKLERRAGLSKRRKVFRRGDKDVVRVFSKQSANYIGARTQLDVLRNIKRVKGSLTQAQEDGLARLKKMLEDAKSALPKEIQEALEAYIAWDRKFYKELNNLRMREGTLSERQIQELREEGYWGKDGELYRPSYRVDPNRETKLVRNDERVARDNDTATEQYVWGSDKDFMDPEVARYMYMGDAGNVFNARQYIDAVNAIPSTKSHVVHDADEVARVQRMKDIKTPLKDRIKSVTTGVFKSGKISTGESAARALSLYKMRAEWVKQAGKVTDAKLKLARASRNKIKITASDKRAAIGAMTQDQLDEIFTEAGITFNFSKMNSPEEFKTLYNSLDKTTQKYLQQKMGSVAGILYPADTEDALERAISGELRASTSLVKDAPYITAENYNKLAQMDSSFVPGLKKSLAQNRKDLRDSSLVAKGVEDAKRAQITAEREGLLKENLDELDKLTKEGLSNGDKDAILEEFDAGIDEYLDTIYKDKKLARSVDDIIEQSGTVDKEAAREYIALEELLRDDNKELAEIRKIAKDDMGKDPAKQNASDMFERMFEDKLAERRNIARQKLVDENSKLVDRKSWMEEIRKADQQIRKDLAEPGYISIPNARGEMEVWEVDPIAADLYNYSAKQPEMGAVAKFFNETSKIFRLGTTGLNITSFVNQSFRDFGNLWLTSGSYHMINFARADMVDLVGPEIARWYQREEPEVYKQLVELAERRGKSVEAMVVERELAIGRETSTQATETAMLKTVSDARTLNKISKGEMSITNDALDRVVDKLSALNERRERYFRNLVYTDSLNQALKRGHTIKEARIQAEFMMNNATTNFSRQMVHLQALQRTVPYLGAAVNGTKSFYRVLSVDPVGVMSRLVGGFVLPIMAFTGMALNDPVARKKYEQLNEYEKDNNIIISVNGSLVKIPIPQEIGSLVKPWQHLVEKMWGSNRHDFWELMLNDALGISPMDITGFYDLDQDAMENPAVWDRFDNGIKQLVVGQMAPPSVKAAYMLATGQDPYTGKFIDTSYQYYDSESGEVITMDSSQSAFAQMLADNFGASATVLGAVINALAGRTAGDVLDAVTTAAQYVSTGGEEGSLTTLFERAGEEAAKPITVAEYDRTRTAWNREISALYREKEGILNNPRYKEIEEAINTETDQQKLKKLKAQRQDMLDGWYDKTKTAIDRLQDNLGGTIDRYRMASLISLLNMYESTGGISGPGRAANEELYYEGRDEAIRALISMGANEAGDNSILGYVTRVKQNDGSETTEVKFYKPLEILAMQNAWYGNASVSKAYVQELLEDGDIDYTQKLKQIKKLRQKIYDKGTLSQEDKNNITALELNWNSEIMMALAPYIERVSPESAVNDEEVMEYLDDLILVPSEFKKDKRGYTVTNKSLGNGSANDAYIKNYIRYIFGVNDTGYESGKNYSGRQTLGGE